MGEYTTESRNNVVRRKTVNPKAYFVGNVKWVN